MGIIYVPYILILSSLTFFLCLKQQQPKWWAAVALVFPPILPVVIMKTKINKSKLLVIVFCITFVIVMGAEVFLFLGKNTKAEDTTPPIIKEVIALNKDVERTTIDIYNASGKLHAVSLAQSRVGDLQKAVEIIENIRGLVDENHKAIENLIEFIDEHQTYFLRKNLAWVLSIKAFYTDHHVVQQRKSQAQYLAAFEVNLKYTYKNFDKIMVDLSKQHMMTYDAYYMRYRRAADAFNRFNRKRITFQNSFVEEHPEVKPFLPGSHHHEPFKFWDKFQF